MFTPFSLLVLTSFFTLIHGQSNVYPTAGLKTTWIADTSAKNLIWFPSAGIFIVPVLLQSHNGSIFACGFYSQAYSGVHIFSVSIVQRSRGQISIVNDSVPPAMVWSANRNRPVGNGASLEFTEEGDLVLQDADKSVVWSTQTYGKSVAGMNLTESGNLVLFNEHNVSVWQSFDHPTDTLLPGQKLRVGQKLAPSDSATNLTEEGLLSLSLTTEGLFAQMETDPPQVYYSLRIKFPNTSNDSNYVEFSQGSLTLFVNFEKNGSLFSGFNPSATVQFMKFEPDGHLRIYEQHQDQWIMAHDILTNFIDYCGYPMVCGNYGICDVFKKCRCPDPYFKPTYEKDPTLGCSERVPLSCEASQFQSFLNIGGFSYFTFRKDPQSTPDLRNTDAESCQKACANNCSCRAAFFQTELDGSDYSGSCYLVSQVFSLAHPLKLARRYVVSLKVQNQSEIQNSSIPSGPAISPNSGEPPDSPKKRKSENLALIVIITVSLGSVLAFAFLVVVMKCLHRNKAVDKVEEDKGVSEVEKDYLDQIPGAPKRFTYDELKAITEDFHEKLGVGGFSFVYHGTLANGTKVAVKELNGLCQINKSFLAEVCSIGNIHHVNLVRLIGFCAENFHKLLVYEYMSKGSLEKWIFPKSNELFMLDWRQRRKIICDIAKGLHYLHEQCRWKIVHMDIKPQNILLDEKFNAKVADFGLSKLIDRDQSQIVTTMRGTPGYLAPEWLHGEVTEKVDIYSFGVVILEITCGRKVFDKSLLEEDMYLLGVLKRKSEEGQLLDMIDKDSEDMQSNGPQVLDMMKLAVWCLQVDFTRRPSMSIVVKVLEGAMEVPDDLDCNFPYLNSMRVSARTGQENVELDATNSLIPYVLSGPR